MATSTRLTAYEGLVCWIAQWKDGPKSVWAGCMWLGGSLVGGAVSGAGSQER